jgi:GDP-4-dehydro-6-deoxy-D-mannose reductase
MARILVTGFSGFVSRYFLAYLESVAADMEVLGVGRSAPDFPLTGFRHIRCSFKTLDLLDKSGVDEVVYNFRPSHVLHLASQSSVGFSWQRPVESFTNNTNIFLNLIEQVRSLGLSCRILSVGSSEEYGNVGPENLPLREEVPLRPVSPYAVARVAQEMLSKVYVDGYGVDVVMTRSFNHFGPHQRDVFVVPSLAKQLTNIARSSAPPRLVTGDRTIIRDFVDVRDVVRAYFDLLLQGDTGEVYNVCTGRGVSIQEVIDLMQRVLGTNVEFETDPRLIRPSDNRAVIGDASKIARSVGWTPRISLETSIEDILGAVGARV